MKIAHEAFHRVCSGQKNEPDGAEEMFAILYSLTFLDSTI